MPYIYRYTPYVYIVMYMYIPRNEDGHICTYTVRYMYLRLQSTVATAKILVLLLQAGNLSLEG